MAESGKGATMWPQRVNHQPSVCLLLGALSFFLAQPAFAGEDARAAEARTACLAGDYSKGVTILSELFVSTRIPTYIYNQGRCFEQNARYREAISRFREYLRVAQDASADARADAEKHIADCRTLLAQEPESPTVDSAAPPASPVTSAPEAVASVSQPAAAPKPPSDAGSALRAAGIVTAAAGGAALIAGVVLNVKANGMAGDFETYNGYTDQKESRRKSYETWGWVSYGAGAACVATGALLYYLGWRAKKHASSSVAILPTHDGAAFVLEGAL